MGIDIVELWKAKAKVVLGLLLAVYAVFNIFIYYKFIMVTTFFINAISAFILYGYAYDMKFNKKYKNIPKICFYVSVILAFLSLFCMARQLYVDYGS